MAWLVESNSVKDRISLSMLDVSQPTKLIINQLMNPQSGQRFGQYLMSNSFLRKLGRLNHISLMISAMSTINTFLSNFFTNSVFREESALNFAIRVLKIFTCTPSVSLLGRDTC